MGKSHLHHLPSFDTKSESSFDLIYSDAWGLIPISSSKVIVISFNFLMITPNLCELVSYKISPAFEIVKHFKSMVKTQFGCKIKQTQTDWVKSIKMCHFFELFVSGPLKYSA